MLFVCSRSRDARGDGRDALRVSKHVLCGACERDARRGARRGARAGVCGVRAGGGGEVGYGAERLSATDDDTDLYYTRAPRNTARRINMRHTKSTNSANRRMMVRVVRFEPEGRRPRGGVPSATPEPRERVRASGGGGDENVPADDVIAVTGLDGEFTMSSYPKEVVDVARRSSI